MPELLLWVFVLGLFMLGLAGIIIPGMPGIALVFLGILLYAFATDFTAIGVTALLTMGLVSFLAMLTNYAGSVLGSRYGGGKKLALVGTLLGAFIGAVTGGPLGIFIGAFIGALVGAVMEGNDNDKAFKIAIFSVVGILGGSIVQMVLALTLIIAFIFLVVF